MSDVAAALADKPDPFGLNVPWDPNDAAKVCFPMPVHLATRECMKLLDSLQVRAWSASFGAGPLPVPPRDSSDLSRLKASTAAAAPVSLCPH